MIEQVELAFAIFGMLCLVLLAASLAFIAWDTRVVVIALAADVRKAMGLLLAPAARSSKAPVGYDARRGAETTTKADTPPDSAC